MASYLKGASALWSRSNLASNYIFPASSSSSPSPNSVQIGAWNVTSAKNKSTGKTASIWEYEKPKGLPERALEVLRKEASSLGRLRHPCILEMVEPVEETRSLITFATEPVTSSLRQATNRSRASDEDEDLDEVEVSLAKFSVFQAEHVYSKPSALVDSKRSPASSQRVTVSA
jgi:SCY1-like protein 2